MCLLSQNTLPDLGICTHLYILKCRCVFFACMMQLTETFIDFYTGRGSQVVGGFPGGCYDNPVSVPCTSWQPEGLLCRARVRHTHAHKHTHKYIPTLPTVDCLQVWILFLAILHPICPWVRRKTFPWSQIVFWIMLGRECVEYCTHFKLIRKNSHVRYKILNYSFSNKDHPQHRF